jgi:hypothetical protein
MIQDDHHHPTTSSTHSEEEKDPGPSSSPSPSSSSVPTYPCGLSMDGSRYTPVLFEGAGGKEWIAMTSVLDMVER